MFAKSWIIGGLFALLGVQGAACASGETMDPGATGEGNNTSTTVYTGGGGNAGGDAGGNGGDTGNGGSTNTGCEPGKTMLCQEHGAEPPVGLCNDGFRTCLADGTWSDCEGQIGPKEELCDGLDNDCDSAIDEDNPGSGDACNTDQFGVCAAGTLNCVNGALNCVPDMQPSNELCDGLDNNCDGATDEGNPGSGNACNTGQPGVCSTGTLNCVNGALICTAPESTEELCDGLDNNCDSAIDEGNPGGGDACNTGQPGVCANGTLNCVNGALNCVPDMQPSNELCDGLDNNCDSATDEGNPGGGGMCNTDQLGVCAAGTLSCINGMLTCVQNTQPTVEVCYNNNKDENCDGMVNDGCNSCDLTCATGKCLYKLVNVGSAGGAINWQWVYECPGPSAKSGMYTMYLTGNSGSYQLHHTVPAGNYFIVTCLDDPFELTDSNGKAISSSGYCEILSAE